MNTLEEEFMALEAEIEQRLERYKELCERMGFDFREHAEDLVDKSEGVY